MRTLDVIKPSLSTSKGFAEALLRDLAAEPLVRAPADTGPHAYWLLGHLVVANAAAFDQYIRGRVNRHQAWRPLFGIGSTPKHTYPPDAPTFEALLVAFDALYKGVLAHVDTLSELDLDEPCHENDWNGSEFGSVGECLSAIAQHTMFHAGQAACCRRAAGRKPLFL